MRRTIQTRSTRPAFTLIELLVVMVIMTVLVSSVLVASSALITRSKISNTQALLALVEQSIEAFEREQRAQPTIARVIQGPPGDRVRYTERYGHFPPDELEVFTAEGLPGAGSAGKSIAPGGALIYPEPPYASMQFDRRSLDRNTAADEHRDIAALFVAIQLFGKESKTLLDRVQDRYWINGPTEGPPEEIPTLFLDRDESGNWTEGDLRIRFLVDDWGVPLSYMAQRDWDPANPELSTNHDEWNEAATEMVRLNDGRPVIFSWGPDGEEQLTAELMGVNAAVSVVGDFENVNGLTEEERMDDPLNADNVYANVALKVKLDRGL